LKNALFFSTEIIKKNCQLQIKEKYKVQNYETFTIRKPV